MTSKVATCKTFDEFLMMWTRYRIQKEKDNTANIQALTRGHDFLAAEVAKAQKNINTALAVSSVNLTWEIAGFAGKIDLVTVKFVSFSIIGFNEDLLS
jgi:nickel-dependent lactate racemase